MGINWKYPEHGMRKDVLTSKVSSVNGINGFHSIFLLWQLEGITSPCCLHHMVFLPSSFYGERCYEIHLYKPRWWHLQVMVICVCIVLYWTDIIVLETMTIRSMRQSGWWHAHAWDWCNGQQAALENQKVTNQNWGDVNVMAMTSQC